MLKSFAVYLIFLDFFLDKFFVINVDVTVSLLVTVYFLYVALKEAHEESGLKNIKVLLKEPISLEILPVTYHIKNGKFVSSHTHMNLTYLFAADEKEELTIKPDENSGLKWVLIDDVLNMTNEEAMKPIYQKLNKVLKEV